LYRPLKKRQYYGSTRTEHSTVNEILLVVAPFKTQQSQQIRDKPTPEPLEKTPPAEDYIST